MKKNYLYKRWLTCDLNKEQYQHIKPLQNIPLSSTDSIIFYYHADEILQWNNNFKLINIVSLIPHIRRTSKTRIFNNQINPKKKTSSIINC